MRFRPISPRGLKTYSIRSRKSKVEVSDFARPPSAGKTFKNFLDDLPDILAAKDLREIVSAVKEAVQTEKVVAAALGAHVIKVGLNPVIIDLMERGILQGIALNGAGIVHDFEVAYAGRTSEDVDAEIGSGTFGMAEETGRFLNKAIINGAKKGWGLGRSVGELIQHSRYPHKKLSILAAGIRLGIPVTVHVAIGADILHLHPEMNGASTGKCSYRDFQIFSGIVARLEGGVYLNIGSAVMLPEVFLKALTLVRNLGYDVLNFTTVNMDFLQHYRPVTNVVKRPTKEGSGKGYTLTGHHEIMVPILAAAIVESLSKS